MNPYASIALTSAFTGLVAGTIATAASANPMVGGLELKEAASVGGVTGLVTTVVVGGVSMVGKAINDRKVNELEEGLSAAA